MPKLPVATAFWTPEPNLATGAESWILAGGAHHTAFSYDLTAEQMGDWADAMVLRQSILTRTQASALLRTSFAGMRQLTGRHQAECFASGSCGGLRRPAD